MIGRISGVLVYHGDGHVMIDVRGVGYLVHVSDRTLMAMPSLGEPVALYTDLLVREDLLQLFGFPSLLEKEWHKMLMSVQGIGAKASMAILGAIGAEGVSRAIAMGDWNAVKAAPGVGPKIAQRVVNELKDKAPGLMALGGAVYEPVLETGEITVSPKTAGATAPAPSVSRKARSGAMQADALSALLNLGYGQGEAASAVAQAATDAADEATEAGLIRAALRLLAPKG
ncbi:MAG: Holliday junction DNA helicase RuvA [Paracoccaceae bacterium]|jgi:Holliday junction DNA helicase RuvA